MKQITQRPGSAEIIDFIDEDLVINRRQVYVVKHKGTIMISV